MKSIQVLTAAMSQGKLDDRVEHTVGSFGERKAPRNEISPYNDWLTYNINFFT